MAWLRPFGPSRGELGGFQARWAVARAEAQELQEEQAAQAPPPAQLPEPALAAAAHPAPVPVRPPRTVSPAEALGLVSNWLSAAFADPHAHGPAIAEVTSTMSSLLRATQAVGAALSAQARAQAVPVVLAPGPAQSKAPDVVVAAEDGSLQVVSLSAQASARQDTAAAVKDDSDKDMASEAEAQAELVPVDPRPPPPDAKKPRCGDPQELIIAT